MDNICLLHSIAAGNNWLVVFRDIAAAAFLYSDLLEPMYMFSPAIMGLPPHILL